MSFFHRARGITVLAAVLACTTAALAEYPDKPIRFVVPFSAGSSTDLIARAVGAYITAQTHQPVIVDNKPGANGFLGATDVARAAPDGYTVLITTNTTHAANEHLFRKLPYDPVKDFTPLTALAKGSLVLVVNQQSPVKNVKDLISYARKQQGKASFASGTSSSRIASELFRSMANLDLVYVPYKSNPPAIQDLMGGQVDMMMADTPTALPLVKSGKLRALGVSGKTREALIPDVPTMDEAGLAGYEMTYWYAAYAPAKLAVPIQNRLNELMTKAVRQPAVQEEYRIGALQTFLTSPGELAAFQMSESSKWASVIRAAKIEPE